MMVALVDCNSFYASCEKIFRPDLKDRPVVVLSNNDGCIVAMSKEAKAMGIKRGAPLFKYRKELKRLGAACFSSNYTLYQDISDRVMELLRQQAEKVEVYSIDEAFLQLGHSTGGLEHWGVNVIDQIARSVGVPVSVGVGRSKTLAKIAASVAKKRRDFLYIMEEDQEEEQLRKVMLPKLWGIGPAKAEYLLNRGILTAWDLRNMEDWDVKKNLSLVTLRTLWELRGIPSIPEEEPLADRKGILSSLGFSRSITDRQELSRAVASYTVRAARKLWKQDSLAGKITVFIMTNRYKSSYCFKEETLRFEEPTCYLPDMTALALECLERIFIQGMHWAKAGVLLTEIQKDSGSQLDLFRGTDPARTALTQQVKEMELRYGKEILTPLTARMDAKWSMKRKMLSPEYTTSWKGLPRVY